MKTRTKTIAALVATLSTAILLSCSNNKKEEVKSDWDNTSTEAQKNSEEAANKVESTTGNTMGNDVGDDWRREREQFRTDINQRIDKNKQDIDNLKAEAKNKKKEMKKDYEKRVDDLEKRNDKLRNRLQEEKNDTKDNWESFKREFNHDMDELGNSISDLFKDNKN
jgi:hypothetical protein